MLSLKFGFLYFTIYMHSYSAPTLTPTPYFTPIYIPTSTPTPTPYFTPIYTPTPTPTPYFTPIPTLTYIPIPLFLLHSYYYPLLLFCL